MTSGLPEKCDRAEKRELRRQQIVDTAARLFAELGFSNCEMERLASELQIAKGTLYLYFPGKEDLFLACVDRGMSQMQQAVSAAAQTCDEPLARISAGIRAYLTFFEENSHYVELLIQERAIFKDRQRPTYFEYRDANRGPWRELYTRLVTEKLVRDDLAIERMLDTVGNLIYGTMFTNHFIGRKVSLDEQQAVILGIIFDGILTSEGKSRRTQLTSL